ncbi:MAG: 3-oxoacyl-[acyl-carrier-protein] synthase III [Arenicella sp.]|jgi:3-oxoacyl-[acyl-carrier-protein] synthase III
MSNTLSILGTGVYLPPARSVTELVKEVGQDPGDYQGWANCCHALEDDHPSSMGVTALRKALEQANVDPAELKLVLFAGMSRDFQPSWSVSTEIMKICGAKAHCVGLDMTIGCLGALSALDMAQGWLATHRGGVAAIVGAENWTYTIDYTSIENMGLWSHSDGAAAAVVSHGTDHHSKAEFYGAETVTQSNLNGTVLIEYGGTRNPIAPDGVKPFERKLVGLDRHDLRKCYSDGYTGALDAIKARFDCNPQRVVINQTANLFLHLIASVIEIPIENFIVTGHETGHVGSADILIGIDRLLGSGDLSEPCLVSGSTPYAFGAGLMMPT